MIRRFALVFAAAAAVAASTPVHADYVVSSNTGALRRYDALGNYLGDILGPNNGLLGAPQHMAFHDGRILVCGYYNHLVSVVDPDDGQVVAQWSAPGATNPAFLRLSPDGQELWVSYLTSNRIVRFDPDDGTVLGDLVQPGLIQRPHGIEVLADGSWLITSSDDGVYRVTGFDQATLVANIPSSGRPLNTLVLPGGDTTVVTSFVTDNSLAVQSFRLSDGQVLGAFGGPRGIQADGLVRAEDGAILVVFWGTAAVGRYSDDGTFLNWWIPAGSGLQSPNHILWIGGATLGAAPVPRESIPIRLAGPSPFRGRTAVRFSLPAPSDVSLFVTGVDGRRLRTLHEGPLEAGVHVSEWDGRDALGRPAAAGIYWIRLSAGGRAGALSVVRLQ